MPGSWYCPNPTALTSSKRIVDSYVIQPSPVEIEGRICPQMSDEKFFEMMLSLRDRAIKVVQRRLNALAAWNASESERVKEWFGINDYETKLFLHAGLTKLIKTLTTLTAENFVKYDLDFGEKLGCAPSSPENQVAAVCRTEIKNHIIGFTRLFCGISDISPWRDSKISILIHEISHFEDVIGTYDHIYGLPASKMHARMDIAKPRLNADSYSGYICEGMALPD
jgi:hypothetical protein